MSAWRRSYPAPVLPSAADARLLRHSGVPCDAASRQKEINRSYRSAVLLHGGKESVQETLVEAFATINPLFYGVLVLFCAHAIHNRPGT